MKNNNLTLRKKNISKNQVITLSLRDQQLLIDSLNNPFEFNASMNEAFERHKQWKSQKAM